jgi:crossover junction endodeoxyribonuclease RusA
MMVTLPWPPSALSPNARSGTWHKATRAKKAYRALCFWTAKPFLRPLNTDIVDVSITFNPPDRRKRDDDNIIASFKSGRDAVAQLIGVDDANWQVKYHMGAPVKGGAVQIKIVLPEVLVDGDGDKLVDGPHLAV